MSSLQDRLNRETEVLKLEAGESVVGTLVELTLRDSGVSLDGNRFSFCRALHNGEW